MTALKAMKSVRLVKTKRGPMVIVPLKKWEKIMDKLEDLEDARIVKEAMAELEAAGGDPVKAGWVTIEEFEAQLNETQNRPTRQKSPA